MDVSIVLPVFGNAPFLKETFDSVAYQDARNLDIELIVVLDRPSRPTRTLCTNTSLHMENLVIIETINPGIVSALNMGLKKARGKYIARIDSDDQMHPSRIRLQYIELEKNEDLVCIGTQVQLINEFGQPLGTSYYPTKPRDIARVLPFRNCIAHPSAMIRKNILEKIGYYNHEFQGCEDYDLWLKLFNGRNIMNINQTLTHYRIWSNQVTQRDKKKIADTLRRVRLSYFLNSKQNHSRQLSNDLIKKKLLSHDQIDVCFDVLKYEHGLRKYYLFFLHFFRAILRNPIEVALFAITFIKVRFNR